MKKVLLFFALFMGLFGTSWAYDFSAVSPSGHTLHYSIIEGGVTVAGADNATGSLTIPGSVVHNGTTYSVTKIGFEAFSYCTGLTSVTIPYSVTFINTHAFTGCSGLTSVNYTGTITQWCNIAFLSQDANPTYYSHSLNINGSPISTNLVIPDSVTIIESFAFTGCSGLTAVTIPNSVTSIGLNVFSDCSGLTSVTFNATNCMEMGFGSINGYDYSVFKGCTNLTTLTIGENVTNIPSYAFYKCNNLTAITFEGRFPPAIGEKAFYNVPSNVSVTIPCGTLALYAARLPSTWNNYTETTLSFAAQSADESMGTVQVLNEPTCTNPNAVLNAVPASGYRFDHWSTGSTQNPYSLTVTTDTVITAYFVSEGGTETIEDIKTDDVNIYVKDGRIVVEGTTEEYSIYDITGRMVAHSHGAEVSSPLSCGVYLVKVGLRPARKVVVR